LHPSVRKIVKGVRDGRLAQPMREVRYAPSEQRTIKPNPRYEKTIEMLEEFQEKEAEAMRKAHEKDVFYPKLGIFLGSVNVESVQEGSVFSDSFSSDSQDREFYYVPGQRNYIAFLRRISCRSWGFVGLMPSEICQGFEEVNPKVVVQSIDVLKAAREMAKYLSLGDREKAHHSYHAFLQDHNSPTDDFGLIKPAGFRFRLSWV
jgi:hypothetical protein